MHECLKERIHSRKWLSQKQPVLLWPPIMSISKASVYGFDISFIDLRYESCICSTWLISFECFILKRKTATRAPQPPCCEDPTHVEEVLCPIVVGIPRWLYQSLLSPSWVLEKSPIVDKLKVLRTFSPADCNGSVLMDIIHSWENHVFTICLTWDSYKGSSQTILENSLINKAKKDIFYTIILCRSKVPIST